MKIRKQRFTLIELLAVIAIASMLMVLFVPAFSRMMKGSKVDQLASNLKLGLEQAQSRAVASRKYVALVLPNKIGSDVNERMLPYAGGGYRMAYVRRKSSGSNDNWSFLGWVPESEWNNKANDGAMLVQIVTASKWANPQKSGNVADGGKTSWSITNDTVIKTNGLLKNLVDIPNDESDLNDLGASSGTLSNCIIVFSPFGGLADRNEMVKFTVMSAVISPDKDQLRFENPDDFAILRVNAITGRVNYSDIEASNAENENKD